MNKQLIDVMMLSGDKYSKNIAKFAKNNKHWIFRIISVPWNEIDGYSEENRTLYFNMNGNDQPNDLFSGVSVHKVRCGRMSHYAYCNFRKYADMAIDVTDVFIKRYSQEGVCFFGIYSDHDFLYINKNSRKCKNCNLHEKRNVFSVVSRKRVEAWA